MALWRGRAEPVDSFGTPLEWRESQRRRDRDAGIWGGVDSMDDRLRIARRRFYLTSATSVAVAGVLVASAFFPPFLVLAVPPGIMAFDLGRKLRSLAGHGHGFWDVMSSGEAAATRHRGEPPGAPPPGVVPAARRPGARGMGEPPGHRDRGARWRARTAEAERGRHGVAVRRCVEDAAAILDAIDSLAPADGAMLPEIAPTVDALVERSAALAITLDRIDASISPSELSSLDSRIERLAADPTATDGARRLVLLEHQRSTVRDLLERRAVLAGKLESAAMTLRSLRFDLLKLRSAGVQSALESMTSATQQAHALSREIGTMLEAGEEVRRS